MSAQSPVAFNAQYPELACAAFHCACVFRRQADFALSELVEACGFHGAMAKELEAANMRLSDSTARLADVTAKVREIHEVMKRGKNTENHGLDGNLACILDHACRKFDPEPI